MKLKHVLGITSYPVYGAGPAPYDISSLDKFKLHRQFIDNFRVTKSDLRLMVNRTWQGWDFDRYFQNLKDAGIKNIWCTQGSFDWQNVQGKQGKVTPVRDSDDPMKVESWKDIGELCKQIAIRYAADTADKLHLANVYQDSTYISNTPKAGLDLIEALEIINEWDFKSSWSGATRTITPEQYAACFKSCYDAIRSVSPGLKIIMGGGISPDINIFKRFLAQLDNLYSAEGKQTPKDFHLCFHWYMRDGSTDQGGGLHGISPEEAKAYEYGKSLDALCEERGLSGWYCTETGWATDTSKQSAPIQQGFTRDQSQGILMTRLALIWGACKYHKGTSFWHCANNYDGVPYAKGGVNYRNDPGHQNWTPKPARPICEKFIAEYGEFEVESLTTSGGVYYAKLSNGQTLAWSDKTNVGGFTPVPTLTGTTPPPDDNPPPNPTNMIIGYSTKADRTDFKEITEGQNLPTGNLYIEARNVTPTVYFTLRNDSTNQVLVDGKQENAIPYDAHGGSAWNAPQGNFTLTVKDKTSEKTVKFSVGTVAPPPPPPPPTEKSKVTVKHDLTNGSITFDYDKEKVEVIFE